MSTADVSSLARFVETLSNPGGKSSSGTGIKECINLLFLASKRSCNTDPDRDGASSAANRRTYTKVKPANLKSSPDTRLGLPLYIGIIFKTNLFRKLFDGKN